MKRLPVEGIARREAPGTQPARPRVPAGLPVPHPLLPAGRTLLATLGVASTLLGVVGVFVPGLPTTPFLLLASWLFARSSPALRRRLHEHPWLGPYIERFQDGRGLPVRAKVGVLAVLWATLATSAALLLAREPARTGLAALLACIGIGVTWYVAWRVPTDRRG